MDVGTVAVALLADKFTRPPPEGAGAASVIVAVESSMPAVTVDGESERLAMVTWPCGSSVADAVTFCEPSVAVIFTVVS